MTIRARGCGGLVKHLQTVCTLALLLCGSQVYALGLGELRIQSALDEPLIAEIEFASIKSEELETLEITLGSREDFNAAGIILYPFLKELQFEVVAAGRAMIRISSQQPITEPFLHFIIRARWDFGMILSEYTALLDPPLYAGQQPGSVSSPVVLEEVDQPVAVPLPDESESMEEVTPDPLPQSQSTVSGFSGMQYGPIASGDTLWGIATQVDTRDLDVNVFQIMIAFLRNNPDAFVDNNINRLKIGQMLRLRDSESIRSISKAEASRAYQAQIELWESGNIDTAAKDTVIEAPAHETEAEPEVEVTLGSEVDSGPETKFAPPEEGTTETVTEQELSDDAPIEAAEAESPDKYKFKIAPPTSGEGEGDSIAPPDADVEIEAMRAAIDREINTLREQVAELENKQREMKSLSSAEAELEALRTKAGDEINALRDQIAFLKKAAADQEIQALRGQIAAMKQPAATRTETSGDLVGLTAAQMEIRDLRAQIETLKQPGKSEAEPAPKDFSDLSDQVAGLQDQQSASPASSTSGTEIAAIKAAAEEQVNAMREQVNAMRVQMAIMKQNQTQQDQQNANLQERVTQLIDMLEGQVESTELATLTAPGSVDTVEEKPAVEEDSTPAAKKRMRVDMRGDSPPFWETWLDKMADDGMTRMAIAGIAMLFLVVLWLLIRRRRSLGKLEDSLLTGSAFDGPASLLSGLRAKKKPRYMSELTMAGMGRMEADEVDPLAEAEVYLAYGRVDQAEQVLKEASARDPERHELTVKLLEIYQQADDVRSFDALVSKLNLNEQDVNPVIWSNVVALRLKMHKDSPLQPGKTSDPGSAEENTPSAPESLDWELPLEETADQDSSLPEKADAGLSDDNTTRASSPASDLNPFPQPDRSAGMVVEDLDILGVADEPESTAPDRQDRSMFDSNESGRLSSDSPDLSEFEIDSGSDALVDDHGQNLEAGRVPSSGGRDTGDGYEGDQSGRWNDVAIKVELAQAYLNMGEKEEALSILTEVEHDGNPEQKSQIAELIRQANRG